jgi:hypothetical protein
MFSPLCWVLALLFPGTDREGIFVNLMLGTALHFSMDFVPVSHSSTG